MKKLYSLIFILLLAGAVKAQIRTNNALGGQINTSSAFLDASSYTVWNSSTNIGKGLLFPRVDLISFASISSNGSGIPNNYPNRFDGMVVYNSATGTSNIGSTFVTPGFYYYKNTTTNVNGGKWVRMNDSNDATIGASVYYGVLTTTTPSATDIQGLATKTLGSGSYDGSFDQSTASAGYFTVAIPVSWRNPALKIGGNDTWNVLNATLVVTINNIKYQVWQTDVSLPLGETVAVK